MFTKPEVVFFQILEYRVFSYSVFYAEGSELVSCIACFCYIVKRLWGTVFLRTFWCGFEDILLMSGLFLCV